MCPFLSISAATSLTYTLSLHDALPICTEGSTSYIEIDGSVVVIGKPGLADAEVWLNGPLAVDSPALTRLVTYALSAVDRKSTRLNSSHLGNLVCRLLLEKKK